MNAEPLRMSILEDLPDVEVRFTRKRAYPRRAR
jgi:hypothetical protein